MTGTLARRRSHSLRTAFCVVLIACAILVPLAPAVAAAAGFVLLGTVLPDIVANIRCAASRCDEQTVALLSLVSFRAPPSLFPRT